MGNESPPSRLCCWCHYQNDQYEDSPALYEMGKDLSHSLQDSHEYNGFVLLQRGSLLFFHKLQFYVQYFKEI
jgi:hypothetical protein